MNKIYTCTKKFKRNGKIIGYELKDAYGMIRTISRIDLKIHLALGDIQIDNLKLSTDERIINKNNTKINTENI